MTTYDLDASRQQEVRDVLISNLKHDRLQALLDIQRWSAIPEEHRDGSEEPAIEQAHRRVAICEAQLDALTANHPNGVG